MWRNWLRPWRQRGWRNREVLRGLGAPVELRKDTMGVSHLLAQGEEDLFRAQGFVTAQDRLFQMDMLRRTAAGRLAEVYGDVAGVGFDPVLNLRGHSLTSIDYLMRLLGLQQAAQDGLSWISPRTHRILLAYAEGANEAITQMRQQGQLPLAYKILSQEAEEWHPNDSLLILRLLGFQLSFPWRLMLAFGALCYKLEAQPALLESMLPEHLDLSLGLELLPQGLSSLYQTPDSTNEAAPSDQPTTLLNDGATGQGSCAWVLSSTHTRGGSPLLCNDPHLLLRLPAAFYQIRLYGDEYDVIGLSIPGCPGIFAGHNAEIAWGASLARVDDADIYLEDLDETGERYRHLERFLPLIRREELIKVRGESAKHRWVRSTHRGPLLSDALRGPLPTHLSYSLSWVGHEGVREAEALLQLNRAQNWPQFLQALKYARVPALGYVYADRQGNIGGIIAGRCPVRPDKQRLFRPLPGAENRHDWQGEVPFEDLPRSLNPEEGFIILSGQQPTPQLRGHTIQGLWEPNYRFQRIQDMLQRQIKKRPGAEEMARLQRDQYSLWGREFIERILRPYAAKSQLAPPIHEALEGLLKWNGRVGAESIAAAHFAMFQLKLMDQTYRPAMGEDLYRRWLEIATELGPPVEPLFRAQDHWFEQPRDVVLHTTMTQAYHELQKRLGNDPRQWQWSHIHRLTLRPLFFWSGGLQDSFTRGPFGTGGNFFCINTGNHSWTRPFEHRVGATSRQIIDLSAWDRSRWILCGGQKEDPTSTHYDDQLALWLNGDDCPMHYTFLALRSMEQHWLLPHPKRPPSQSIVDQPPQPGSHRQ